MKRTATYVLMAVMLLGLVPFGSVKAETTSTTDIQALIKQLQDQIKILQEKIIAVSAARQDVTDTAKLISNLREGMSGDEIKILQAALALDSDVYPEGLVTGYYGKLTSQAVKKFQQKHGLETVGVVGPKTKEKLNQLLSTAPVAMVASTTSTEKRPCAIVPPGHLIAPGWLRKNAAPAIPACQTLPPGILAKLGQATTTPPVTTSTPPVTTSTDVTAPVISAIAATNSATSTWTVTWTTNEVADGKVWYATSSVSTSSPFIYSAATSTSHSVSLTGLMASTTYSYLVGSADAANNLGLSGIQSFTNP